MFNKDMRQMILFTVLALALFALVIAVGSAPGHVKNTTANALTGPTPTPDAKSLCFQHLDSIRANRSIPLDLVICTLAQVKEYVEENK